MRQSRGRSPSQANAQNVAHPAELHRRTRRYRGDDLVRRPDHRPCVPSRDLSEISAPDLAVLAALAGLGLLVAALGALGTLLVGFGGLLAIVGNLAHVTAMFGFLSVIWIHPPRSGFL